MARWSFWIEPRGKNHWLFWQYGSDRSTRDYEICPSKAHAKALWGKMEIDFFERGVGIQRVPVVPLQKWADEYLDQRKAKKCYMNFDVPAVRQFVAWKGVSFPLNSVTHDDMLDWKKELLTRLAPTTARMRLAHLRPAFTWARLRRPPWILVDPLESIELPEANVRKRVMEPREVERALELLPAYVAWPFLVLLGTGMRKEEVIQLRTAQLVYNSAGLWALRFEPADTKNGRGKFVELFHMARVSIEIALEQHDEPRVFPWLTDDMLEHWFGRLTQELGDAVSPHVLKHTFCTRFMEQRGDLFGLQQITGNSEQSLRSNYLHLSRPVPQRVDTMTLSFLPTHFPQIAQETKTVDSEKR